MDDATRSARQEPYLEVLRALVEAYLAFSRLDSRQIESFGLTQSQFDVIATLGNTSGLTASQLSDRSLVTKGTLTGVIDRLQAKGLLERLPSTTDRRSTIVRLTPDGEAVFRKVFPALVAVQKPFFEGALTPSEMRTLGTLLLKLRNSFEHS
jgi:DNA-binding MarR family transcriptional regulator